MRASTTRSPTCATAGSITTTTTSSTTIAANTLTSSGGIPSYYRVLFVNSSLALPDCPTSRAATSRAVRPSCRPKSWPSAAAGATTTARSSALCSGSRRRRRRAAASRHRWSPRGDHDLLTGGASVLNFFNDLTVWSGGSLLGQSNTGKTFIRDTVTNPARRPELQLSQHRQQPSLQQPARRVYVLDAGLRARARHGRRRHQPVEQDPRPVLPVLHGRRRPATYRENTCRDLGRRRQQHAEHENSTDVGSIAGMKNNVIWVEGNLTLPSSARTTSPVVLIVNGDLSCRPTRWCTASSSSSATSPATATRRSTAA